MNDEVRVSGHVPSDSLREAELEEALEIALIIIVGEYPKDDERYQFAVDAAFRFNMDIGENG